MKVIRGWTKSRRAEEGTRSNRSFGYFDLYIYISVFLSILSFLVFRDFAHIHILILDPKIGKHGRLHDNPHRGEKKSKRIGWPIFRRIFLPEEG